MRLSFEHFAGILERKRLNLRLEVLDNGVQVHLPGERAVLLDEVRQQKQPDRRFLNTISISAKCS